MSSFLVAEQVCGTLSGFGSCVVGVGVRVPNARDRQMLSLTAETGIVPVAALSMVGGTTVVVSEVSMRCSLVLFGVIAAKLLHGSNKCPLGATSRAKDTVPGDNALSRS